MGDNLSTTTYSREYEKANALVNVLASASQPFKGALHARGGYKSPYPLFSKNPYLCVEIEKQKNMTIKEAIDSVVEEFEFTEDRMEKYEVIIDFGKRLPAIPEEYKNDEHIVRGCQSQVWLHSDYQDGKMIFQADSDAIIPKGLIAILVKVFSNQNPKDILDADLDFLKEIGVWEHLSPNRSNGLSAMLKKMKYYALAFQN